MSYASDWLHKPLILRQTELEHFINGTGKPQHDYIQLVAAGVREGVYASLGPNFEYAIFGRDSIEIAEDLLMTHKELARDIILCLARLQGLVYDNRSEEEPGKIHHEYRYAFFGGRQIPPHTLEILHTLQHKWGNEGKDTMVYYGTYDATPLYVRLIDRYIKLYGRSILADVYVGRDGKVRSVSESFQAAVSWIANKVESSKWGLLEYKRLNPNGLANQTWKDSPTSFLHADGKPANSDGGIAAIELQGYVYDAFMAASQLLNTTAMRRRCYSLAKQVQQKLIEMFWMADKNFFAQGLDRDAAAGTRHIETFTSNPGLLLDSGSHRPSLQCLPSQMVRPIGSAKV